MKTPLLISLPGYVTYRSIVRGSSERGGTVLFIKNHISKLISSVDTSVEDQIWIQLWCASGCLFGFCYIPPCDSRYYSYASFSPIQEKIMSDGVCKKCFIFGDMNIMFGSSVIELPELVELPGYQRYSYPQIADDVLLPNDNAFILSSICRECKLLVVNNLKTPYQHFHGGKTSRKRGEWLSEFDVCVVSSAAVGMVEEFSVLHDESLPSDHAPVSVKVSLPYVDAESLLDRAHHLGERAVSPGATLTNRDCAKPISMNMIDETVFTQFRQH